MTDKGDILIIDDDTTVRSMLEFILINGGYSVRFADSGETGLAAVAQQAPELILLDIYMGDMNGFEVLKRLKSDSTYSDIPIIFLSGAPEVEKRTEGLMLGAVDFIAKPFHNTELLARVQTHLELQRLRNRFKHQADDLRLANDLLLQEIAERKKIEDELLRSHAFIDTLLNAIPVPVFYKDADGRYLGCNTAFENFYGMSRHDLLGKCVTDIAPKELAQVYLEKDQELLQHPGAQVYETQVRVRDGGVREVFFHKATFTDSAGKVGGLIGAVIDITERKRNQEALLEKNTELERFTYTVSHDLRSPLVTIRTFLNHLIDDMSCNDRDAMAQDLGFITAAADKMNGLLDELLQLSRIGRVASAPDEALLQDLVREALALVAGRISQGNVQVQVTDQPVVLYGDRSRLVEVFQNLIDNAVKFMGSQAAPKVEIGAEETNGETVLFVRDNGMGIYHENSDKIFGLFEKLDPEADGTGMGLALVKRIMEVHGGRIWVESDGPGTGACFWFTLPKKQV